MCDFCKCTQNYGNARLQLLSLFCCLILEVVDKLFPKTFTSSGIGYVESDEAKDILKELFCKSDDELLDKESIGGWMGGCSCS